MLSIKLISIIAASLIILSGCTTTRTTSLLPAGMQQHSRFTLSAGDLTVTFADNSAFDQHRAGYNGIASLKHREEGSPFVPLYAGFNLEYIFGGDSLVQLFEPRRHPMQLFRKSNNEVVLYQAPTPISGVESSTTFKVAEPHYIDIEFKCRFTNTEFFKHGYAGLFWASYINEPEDKKIYFYGTKDTSAPSWVSGYSHEHGVKSTHRSTSDTASLYYATNFNATLASNFSDLRFVRPFYYGKFRDMYFAYLFDEKSLIRFSQSPTGGGEKNPAWDFHFIVRDPQPGKVYSFKSRLVYKRYSGNEDVESEYAKWKQ